MSNKWLQELFFLPRIPEAEIMGNGEGTEAYSSAVSQAYLDEIARVSKLAGAILLRDLRRPLAVAFAAHVTWFGRHYRGLMKKLYVDSVKAAYTPEELETLLSRSEIRGGQIFRKGLTHIGIERRAV